MTNKFQNCQLGTQAQKSLTGGCFFLSSLLGGGDSTGDVVAPQLLLPQIPPQSQQIPPLYIQQQGIYKQQYNKQPAVQQIRLQQTVKATQRRTQKRAQ